MRYSDLVRQRCASESCSERTSKDAISVLTYAGYIQSSSDLRKHRIVLYATTPLGKALLTHP